MTVFIDPFTRITARNKSLEDKTTHSFSYVEDNEEILIWGEVILYGFNDGNDSLSGEIYSRITSPFPLGEPEDPYIYYLNPLSPNHQTSPFITKTSCPAVVVNSNNQAFLVKASYVNLRRTYFADIAQNSLWKGTKGYEGLHESALKIAVGYQFGLVLESFANPQSYTQIWVADSVSIDLMPINEQSDITWSPKAWLPFLNNPL